MRLILILSIVWSAGCGNPWCEYNGYAVPRDADGNRIVYGVHVDQYTESGVAVDSGGYDVVETIEAEFVRMEECLSELVEGRYHPVDGAQCLESPLRRLQDRECFTIKVVPPIVLCSGWHALNHEASQALCDAKGLSNDPECPCMWRWAIQRDYELVTPIGHMGAPYLYDVVRMHTGCNNPWADDELVNCMHGAGGEQ